MTYDNTDERGEDDYCDCPDCAFADQVSKAVHLLQTIGLDITYTDEGLAVIARQIIRIGLRQALESVQGMRGLTLDGPRMQVHAEERIKRLLRTDAVWSAPDGLLRGLCNHADVLAAIDALKGEQP